MFDSIPLGTLPQVPQGTPNGGTPDGAYGGAKFAHHTS